MWLSAASFKAGKKIKCRERERKTVTFDNRGPHSPGKTSSDTEPFSRHAVENVVDHTVVVSEFLLKPRQFIWALEAKFDFMNLQFSWLLKTRSHVAMQPFSTRQITVTIP